MTLKLPPDPVKRLNYFDHQFLRAKDFTDEQTSQSAFLGRNCQIVPDLRRYSIKIFSAPHLARIQRLKRPRAGAGFNPHRRGPDD